MDKSMDDLIKKYSKRLKRKKILLIFIITLDVIAIVTCFITFLVLACQGNKFTNLFGALYFGLPLLSLIIFFVKAFSKDKLMDQLCNELRIGNYSAEDIMIVGKTLNVGLFGLALEVRCFKELGLSKIPEWCARDGVLPS